MLLNGKDLLKFWKKSFYNSFILLKTNIIRFEKGSIFITKVRSFFPQSGFFELHNTPLWKNKMQITRTLF